MRPPPLDVDPGKVHARAALRPTRMDPVAEPSPPLVGSAYRVTPNAPELRRAKAASQPSLSPLQIRRRRMARHRWRQRHLRPSLQLIIRRALRWRCGRWRCGATGGGWLGVSPRRQPPLHPRRAHNGRSRLHPLLIARPEHALPLPPHPFGANTAHPAFKQILNAIAFIPFHPLPRVHSFSAGAGNRGRSCPRSLPHVITLHRAIPQYPGILRLNRK